MVNVVLLYSIQNILARQFWLTTFPSWLKMHNHLRVEEQSFHLLSQVKGKNDRL